MFTTVVMLNKGFLGDNQQVIAIKEEIKRQYQNNVNTLELNENDPLKPETLTETAEILEKKLLLSTKFTLVVSGSHGLQFIQQPVIKKLIEEKKPIIMWVGHQAPKDRELEAAKDLISVVALPTYIVDDELELQKIFKDKLICMQAVPNTLTSEQLLEAEDVWNKTYPEEAIRPSKNGYIGVFLGGDAPKPDGSYLYWHETQAYQEGHAFAFMANQQNKVLLVTNGPRTGKFYPESPDNKKPLLRQCQKDQWLSFQDLDKSDTCDQNATPHAISAPMDPVSAAFLRGIQTIEGVDYQFFDFRLGDPGKPAKSAYKTMVSVLHKNKGSSAFYAGDSISYAEIAYFVIDTFIFRTSSMNDGHEKALNHFKNLGLIEEIDFVNSFKPVINTLKKYSAVKQVQEDLENIIENLKTILQLEPPSPNMTYQFNRQAVYRTGSDSSNNSKSNSHTSSDTINSPEPPKVSNSCLLNTRINQQ